MNNLGNFLDKFKSLLGSSKFQKDAVISIIKDISKIHLEDKDIEIKDFIIRIKTSPLVRGEIFMRKQKILAELQNALGAKAPKDIR